MNIIKVNSRKKNIGVVGYAKEHNHTYLHIALDKELLNCDFYDAEFEMSNEEKFILHNIEKKEKVVIVPLEEAVLEYGKLNVQIIGYIADPEITIKSCIYTGIVEESINALEEELKDENPTIVEQLYKEINANSAARHTHSNYELLEDITEEKLLSDEQSELLEKIKEGDIIGKNVIKSVSELPQDANENDIVALVNQGKNWDDIYIWGKEDEGLISYSEDGEPIIDYSIIELEKNIKIDEVPDKIDLSEFQNNDYSTIVIGIPNGEKVGFSIYYFPTGYARMQIVRFSDTPEEASEALIYLQKGDQWEERGEIQQIEVEGWYYFDIDEYSIRPVTKQEILNFTDSFKEAFVGNMIDMFAPLEASLEYNTSPDLCKKILKDFVSIEYTEKTFYIAEKENEQIVWKKYQDIDVPTELSDLEQTPGYRTVTDQEKKNWTNKVDSVEVFPEVASEGKIVELLEYSELNWEDVEIIPTDEIEWDEVETYLEPYMREPFVSLKINNIPSKIDLSSVADNTTSAISYYAGISSAAVISLSKSDKFDTITENPTNEAHLELFFINMPGIEDTFLTYRISNPQDELFNFIDEGWYTQDKETLLMEKVSDEELQKINFLCEKGIFIDYGNAFGVGTPIDPRIVLEYVNNFAAPLATPGLYKAKIENETLKWFAITDGKSINTELDKIIQKPKIEVYNSFPKTTFGDKVIALNRNKEITWDTVNIYDREDPALSYDENGLSVNFKRVVSDISVKINELPKEISFPNISGKAYSGIILANDFLLPKQVFIIYNKEEAWERFMFQIFSPESDYYTYEYVKSGSVIDDTTFENSGWYKYNYSISNEHIPCTEDELKINLFYDKSIVADIMILLSEEEFIEMEQDYNVTKKYLAKNFASQFVEITARPNGLYKTTDMDWMPLIEMDNTLTFKNGLLGVNTTNEVSADNTLPITSAAVQMQIGNIEALLKTI